KLLPRDKLGLNRQLVGSQAHGLAGDFFADTLHLEHDGAGLYFGGKEFGAALTATHLYFQRFAGNRGVRADADPNLTATLDVAGHSLTGGLDLAAGDALVTLGLEGELAVSDVVTLGGRAVNAAFAYLAVLGSVRNQHILCLPLVNPDFYAYDAS